MSYPSPFWDGLDTVWGAVLAVLGSACIGSLDNASIKEKKGEICEEIAYNLSPLLDEDCLGILSYILDEMPIEDVGWLRHTQPPILTPSLLFLRSRRAPPARPASTGILRDR